MDNELKFDSLVHAFVKRVAAQIRAELAEATNSALQPRLLTVEGAATYMGRTEEAMQHMVANGKVPTVRIDRRVFIDVRDLEMVIEHSKSGASR